MNDQFIFLKSSIKNHRFSLCPLCFISLTKSLLAPSLPPLGGLRGLIEIAQRFLHFFNGFASVRYAVFHLIV